MSKVKASIHPLYAAARRGGYTAYIAIAEVYMKSFREFADENARENSATNGAREGCGAENNNAENVNAENNGAAEFTSNGAGESAGERVTAETLTRRIAAAYRGKNDKAVLADIVSSAEKGKRAGTLTNEEIDAFYRRFAPMLNFVQRKKLEQIVTQLKNI